MSRISTSLLLVAALVATIPAPVAAQPQDPVVQLLEALPTAPGPSGFEGPVRDIVTIGPDDCPHQVVCDEGDVLAPAEEAHGDVVWHEDQCVG